MKRVISCVLLFVLAIGVPARAAAQVPGDVWRNVVEKIDAGAELDVRLQDGTRFRAILVDVRPDAVLLQPKTRVPVPVQEVPYEAIALIERRSQGGIGAGKAAAIGVAAGVGTFFAIIAILAATLD